MNDARSVSSLSKTPPPVMPPARKTNKSSAAELVSTFRMSAACLYDASMTGLFERLFVLSGSFIAGFGYCCYPLISI